MQTHGRPYPWTSVSKEINTCIVNPQNFIGKKGRQHKSAKKVEELICGGKGSSPLQRRVEEDKKEWKDLCVVQCKQ